MMTRTFDFIHTHTHVLVYALSVCVCTFIFMYVYYVQSIVFDIVARKASVERIDALSSDIVELEYALINRRQALTLSYAHTLGFVDVTGIHYAKPNAGKELSLLGNAR